MYKGFTGIPPQVLCSIPVATEAQQPQPLLTGKVAPNAVLVKRISSRFAVEKGFAETVLSIAESYADKVFPKKEDILAIIAVESGFDPEAENAGAYGLMQIQYGQHRELAIAPSMLLDPWHSIALGARILKDYYRMTGSREGAYIAYQAGIGAYQTGNFKTDYLDRVVRERNWLISRT